MADSSRQEPWRYNGSTTNTVKTHIAHVFEKLEAKRRTDAINRARELGLLK